MCVHVQAQRFGYESGRSKRYRVHYHDRYTTNNDNTAEYNKIIIDLY
jgi:hypothetical protein